MAEPSAGSADDRSPGSGRDARPSNPFGGSSLMVFALIYLAIVFVRDTCLAGDKAVAPAPAPPHATAPSSLAFDQPRKLARDVGEADEFEDVGVEGFAAHQPVASGSSLGMDAPLHTPVHERGPRVLVQFCTS